MSVARRTGLLLGILLMLIGIIGVVIAVANLYNIDEQPRSVLAAFSGLGVLSFALGFTLVARSRHVPPTHEPPAL